MLHCTSPGTQKSFFRADPPGPVTGVLRTQHSGAGGHCTDTLAIGGAVLASALGTMAKAEQGPETHGISAFGDLKYPPDFKHLEYVNPNAPKGGAFSQVAPNRIFNQGLLTFNSLNSFILKGDAAQGMEFNLCKLDGARRGLYLRKRSASPAAQRVSIPTLRLSVQPASCNAWTNATRRACPWGSSAGSAMSTPIRRIWSGCCARAASGHAATPPRAVMKSRRLIRVLTLSSHKTGWI